MLKLSEAQELEKEFSLNIDDFELSHSHLSHGNGFATNCYKVKGKDGQLVFIKSIPAFFIKKTLSKAKIIREVYNLSKLQYPSLSVMRGVIFPSEKQPLTYSFVTSHVQQESLESFLNNLDSPNHPIWDDTMKMQTAFGIAAAMQFLHYCGFIHGNLSPSNVVFNSEYEAVIVDYWYSKFMTSDYYQSITSEKECWCAPERFSPSGFTEKVDVFSYGMILYQIACDMRPFSRAMNHDMVLRRIQHGDRPFIPDGRISKQLEDLIRRCWDSNPDQRPSFDAILAEFYIDDHPLFPNADPCKFLECRSKTVFPFLQGVGDIAYFDIGDLSGDVTDKFNSLKAAAENGNPKAMYRLWYLTEKDEYIPYLKRGADLGDKTCQYAYSRMTTDKEESLKYLKMAADQDYSKALKSYSMETGDLDMLKRAAQLGFEEALMECYRKTNEVKYLIAAATYHDADGSYQLALLHETGEVPHMKAEYPDLVKPGETKTHEEYVAEVEALMPNKVFKDLGMAFDLYIQGYEWNHEESRKKIDSIYKLGGKLASRVPAIFKQKKEPEKIDLVLMYAMSLVYGDYVNLKRDLPEAIRIFKAAVQFCNSADAAYQLYLIYHRGDSDFHIPPNQEMALRYLKSAAVQGHPTATFDYAKVLAKSVSANPDEAIKETLRYSRYSAQLGDPDALERHAFLLQQISDSEAAEIECAVYYRLAADRGNIEAQYTFAQLAEDGVGLEESCELALLYYRIGAKKGISDNMMAIAELYEKQPSLKKSDREITKEYLKAGCYGSSKGMLIVGSRYEIGQGCERDLKKALKYYRLGAILGNSTAQLKYANMLLSDSDCSANQSEAMHFYALSARLGNVDAQKTSARMYLTGQFLRKNVNKAKMLFKEAADVGDSEAQYEYAMLLLADQPKQTAITEAMEYLVKSADQNNIEAILKLAEIYEQGEYVDENLKVSCLLYRKAGNITGDLRYFTHVAAQLSTIAKTDDMERNLSFAEMKQEVWKDSLWDEDRLVSTAERFGQSLAQFKSKSLPLGMGPTATRSDDQLEFALNQLKGQNGNSGKIEEAIAVLEMLCREGSVSAQRELGRLYLQGSIVTRDLTLAEQYLKPAAQRGDRDALFELGNLDMLMNRTQSALVNYQMAQKRGHVYAKTRCSALLFEGPEGLIPLIENPKAKMSPPLDEDHLLGLKCSCQDLDEMYCFSLSMFYGEKAKSGNKFAQHNYGMLIDGGFASRTTDKDAFVWLKKAANQGLAFSEYTYGTMCLRRPDKLKEGLAYLEKGVAKNYIRSIIELASAYEVGKGVKANPKTALEIANKGVALNDPVCQCIAARLIMKTVKTKDGLTKAMILLNASKTAGNAEAAVMMGTILMKSQRPEDQTRAADCFKFAADKSLPFGHYYYGLCLKNGSGVAKNETEGRKHLKLASSLGVKEAMLELAEMAQKEQKASDAYEYFRRLMATVPGAQESKESPLELLEQWREAVKPK